MKVAVSVEVQKEMSEVVDMVAGLTASIIFYAQQKKSIPENLMSSFSANLSEIMTAISGAEQIPAEFAESKSAFVNAIALMPGKILKQMEDLQATVVPAPVEPVPPAA